MQYVSLEEDHSPDQYFFATGSAVSADAQGCAGRQQHDNVSRLFLYLLAHIFLIRQILFQSAEHRPFETSGRRPANRA